MHEYSIIAALLAQVEHHGSADPKTRVRWVHLRVGELAGVEVELLNTAYETMRKGSICEHAQLKIQYETAAWRCTNCDADIDATAGLRCIACGNPARLAGGDEIILQRIELEKNDV